MTQTVPFVPPIGCYAVIFVNQRTPQDGAGYGEMAEKMVAMAARQPGYLGVDSVRDASGYGITISYWDSEQAIATWRADLEHRQAQAQGRADWYSHYALVVAKVERTNQFTRP